MKPYHKHFKVRTQFQKIWKYIAILEEIKQIENVSTFRESVSLSLEPFRDSTDIYIALQLFAATKELVESTTIEELESTVRTVYAGFVAEEIVSDSMVSE